MIEYADLHCDTLTLEGEGGFLENPRAQVTLKRLKAGGCKLQCFAIFSRPDDGWEKTLCWIKRYQRERENLLAHGVTPVLTVEGGGGVGEDLSRLLFLKEVGVKAFSLTWNKENGFGYPCGSKKGLKPLGKKAVETLIDMGIYPDISHLSDRGISAVIKIAEGRKFPVIATHSLCRSVCFLPRNLTDFQIRKIADLGGVVGVNFVRSFIGDAGILKHIERLLQVGGEEVLSIGSDFDGTENPLYSSPEEMPKFFETLKKAGFSSYQIEKLAIGNAKRLFGL